MKLILICTLVLLADQSFAYVSQNEVKLNTETSSLPSHWSVEGDMQAHSVAGPASPWLGIATAYRIWNPVSLGLRAYIPLSHTVDNATYAAQVYSRIRVSHGLSTDLFLEPSYSENFFNLIPFGSYGMSIGALNRVTPALSIGVAGGVELAKVVVDSVGLENETGYAIYPKIGLLANLNF